MWIFDCAAAFHVAVQNANSESNGNVDPNQEQDILHMSHGVRLLLLSRLRYALNVVLTLCEQVAIILLVMCAGPLIRSKTFH